MFVQALDILTHKRKLIMLRIVYTKYRKIYKFDRIKPLTLGDNSGRINGAQIKSVRTNEYGDATVSTGRENI